MLRAVPKVIGHARFWRLLLVGLWLSGLRLKEAILLTWDEGSDIFVTSDGSDRLYLRIHAENEKGASDRLHPITPDFDRFLKRLVRSPGQRVFPLPWERGQGLSNDIHYISRVIVSIGKEAGVVVNTRSGKTASAHDLRRSFGERWAMAPGVTPQILMTLMRHESIETTLRYYAMMNAISVSDVLSGGVGNKSGNRTRGENPLSNVSD
jgi:integrase